MAGPQEWSKLKCDSCGSIYFLQKFHLVTRAGGGTTEQQAGWVCRQCNADVDMARMIKALDVERKKAELKALQEEVGQVAEPAPGGPKK